MKAHIVCLFLLLYIVLLNSFINALLTSLLCYYLQMVRDAFPGPAGDDVLNDLDALAALSLKWASPELVGEATAVNGNNAYNGITRSRSMGLSSQGSTGSAAAAAAGGGGGGGGFGGAGGQALGPALTLNKDVSMGGNAAVAPRLVPNTAFAPGLSRVGTTKEAREAGTRTDGKHYELRQ
jgi:hypothetical protein